MIGPSWSRFRVSRRLVANTAILYGAAAGSGLIQYVALVVLARALGPSNLGAVVLATTVSGLLAAAVEFGVGPILIRYRSQLHNANPDLWSAIVHIALRIVLGAAVVVVALVVIAECLVAIVGSYRGLSTTLAFAGAIAVPTVFLTFCQSYMQAEQRFAPIAGITVGVAVLRLLLIVGLLSFGVLTVHAALGAYVLALVAATGFAWRSTELRQGPPRPSRRTHQQARQLVLPYLRWTVVGRATVALNGNLDVMLLSGLAGSRATGVYGAASQSSAPLAMLATVVGEVAFPHLAQRDRHGKNRAFLTRWLIWLPPLVVSGFVCGLGGALLLPLILGSAFSSASAPFALLAIMYSLHIWLQPVGSLLYASDRQRFAAGVAMAQGVALLVLDVALIPSLGPSAPPVAGIIITLLSGPVMVIGALRFDRPSADAVRLAAGGR
jgi:O-antigen/teichoic acid export membrane protein